MTVLSDRQLNVAVGGFGAIGRRVAQALDSGIPGLRLAAISARDAAKAKQGMSSFAYPVPILSLKDLAAIADIVVDAAPANALREMAEPALLAGRKLVVISVGALLQAGDLIELARRHGGQIIVPSGALLGLDAVTAAAEGKINSVRMISRKPVKVFSARRISKPRASTYRILRSRCRCSAAPPRKPRSASRRI